MTKKLPNIDPLRGFLALCVVIYHIPTISNTVGLPSFSNAAIFHKGGDAVSVFFTLSGYLIINLLYHEKLNTGAISIKKFYARRILRIYPVYYLVLIFGLFYYHLILPLAGVEFEINYNIFEAIGWCVGFLPNVFKSLYEPGAILIILWSIGIEEQFYLMVAPAFSKTKERHYILVLALFTVGYTALYYLPGFSFLSDYQFLYYYMSAGGLLAILNSQNKVDFLIFSKIGRLLLYFAFLLYFFTDLFEFGIEAVTHTFDIVLFALTILNVSEEKEFVIKNKLLNYLGKISYGIYMYHMIVINFVLFVFLSFGLSKYFSDIIVIILINIAVVLGTIFISHLSFVYLEKYFLSLKHKFR